MNCPVMHCRVMHFPVAECHRRYCVTDNVVSQIMFLQFSRRPEALSFCAGEFIAQILAEPLTIGL